MTQTLIDPVRRIQRQQSSYTALSAIVKSAGLLRRSYRYYATMGVGLCAGLLGLAAASVWLGDSWWQLVIAVLAALVLTQIAFLGHDAAHRQIFASGKHNDLAALLIANLFVGMSIDWWHAKHNKHHAAPNKIGTDPDIEPSVIAFTAEGASNRRTRLGRWLTCRQGYFFFPLLPLTGLQLMVSSLLRLVRPGPVKRRLLELGLLCIRHAVVIGFAFWVMSPPVALISLVVALLVFGFCLGMAFAPNHIGRPIVQRDARIDFLRRQVLMSRNLSGGAFIEFAYGGLNYQIEHHLFPSMSRPNLRRAAPLVAAYCAEIKVHYPQTSPAAAYREVGRYINQVGWDGIDVWRCPLAGTLGR